MPLAEPKFVEAYRASNPMPAHAIRLALEDAGIRVLIENESLQGAVGGIPCGWASAPRLMVEESQLAAAREIIGQTDHGEHSEPGLKLTEPPFLVAASAACLGIALASDAVAVPEQVETTRCLACDAIMSETETTCPKCGWSYEPDGSADSL